MKSTGRSTIVAILVLSILASGLTRQLAQSRRAAAIPAAAKLGADTRTSLSGMDSYALALLLGGLRGPLVMLLWTSSESQKQQKDLEDFDTKVEWIRLLQPEFDTVHLFQIWNKAYNISVQMASLANKYSTILDALDYARSVDRARPDDINIISAIASVYFDKLGNSTEKAYYRHRVRLESQTLRKLTFPSTRENEFRDVMTRLGADPADMRFATNAANHTTTIVLQNAIANTILPVFDAAGVTDEIAVPDQRRRSDPGWRPTEMDPILNLDGSVLPGLLAPTTTQAGEGYDGSEMQFLAKYAPYPYGASPIAIAYNYYSRAQKLQLAGQRHIQLGDTIVDSRPPLALKVWAEDEWERGRRAEIRSYRLNVPTERLQMEEPTAGVKLTNPAPAAEARDEALYSYALEARLCADAVAEYIDHIQRYPTSQNVYASHMDTLNAMMHLANADHDFLAAVGADAASRAKLIANSRDEYQRAMEAFGLVELKYFTDESLVEKAAKVSRSALSRMDPRQVLAVLDQVHEASGAYFGQYGDQYHDDRTEYELYIARRLTRLGSLSQ